MSTFRPEADKPRRSITKDLSKKYSLYAAVGRLNFATVGFSIQSDVQAPLYLCVEIVRWRLVICIYDTTEVAAP